MSEIKLNLARKWRSRTFNEIVGQELPVRMLKNSLYLDHYFPVYLFSGQRGCGKTTAARIFAAAVNCQNLPVFQKNPKEAIPCLSCASCSAMKGGNHPDFIEIDAASHTGVDNVRSIIDAASLMPLLGRKKIYLIDEAHMLSKAAFNAFLKILEEPPASVFFILATTDPQKIIETVTSRCFQVFFKALPSAALVKHLEFVCTKEEISYEKEALELIVKQTEGSVRDALNLLEQVRFTARTVSAQAVLGVLGHLDQERLMHLFSFILQGNIAQALSYMQEISFHSFSASIAWDASVELMRKALWSGYGITVSFSEELALLIERHSTQFFTECLQLFYDHELLFAKTRAQHAVLEYVLVCIAQKVKGGNHGSQSREKASVHTSDAVKPTVLPQKAAPIENQTAGNPLWHSFLEKVSLLNDPLVFSVFKQGRFAAHEDTIITLIFPENFSFFEDLLKDTAKDWQPIIAQLFGATTTVKSLFADPAKQTTPVPRELSTVRPPVAPRPKQQAQQPEKFSSQKRPLYASPQKKVVEKAIDVSDTDRWKKTNLVLKIFPGTVTEVPKDEHA
ncbi:MAG: DNA polymerase III subunit gamma/tau [Candidatus Babeliales bacterium]